VAALGPRSHDATARPGQHFDAESRRWVEGLTARSRRREEALARLHALLLRVARHEVNRRRGWLGAISGPELDDVAHQAADDALLTIAAKVGEFRGASRFTTWAYKFAVLQVSGKMARHAWRQHPPELDDDVLRQVPDRLTPLPHDRAEEREQLRILQAAPPMC
jgi:RNA polymerase sigma-70 factor (ECF subfamily)